MFKIVTDTTADLPESYLKEHDIECLFLPYMMEGTTYLKENDMDVKEFYEKVRNGSMPTTSQVNPDQAEKCFRRIVQTHKEILYIAFSSGLSGTYNSGMIAANAVMEDYPDVKIVVIDSLAASLGEGLLVYKAVQLRDCGMTLDEVTKYVEKNKLNICHIFTVDDLFHLQRGGRVSKTTAIVGTLANIKPILHVDEQGHLTMIGKIRGRRKALTELVNLMEKSIGSIENDIVFISHGDCVEDAEYVAKCVKERFNIEAVLINYVGQTVGAHSGPGTLALFFMGKNR